MKYNHHLAELHEYDVPAELSAQKSLKWKKPSPDISESFALVPRSDLHLLSISELDGSAARTGLNTPEAKTQELLIDIDPTAPPEPAGPITRGLPTQATEKAEKAEIGNNDSKSRTQGPVESFLAPGSLEDDSVKPSKPVAGQAAALSGPSASLTNLSKPIPKESSQKGAKAAELSQLKETAARLQ